MKTVYLRITQLSESSKKVEIVDKWGKNVPHTWFPTTEAAREFCAGNGLKLID